MKKIIVFYVILVLFSACTILGKRPSGKASVDAKPDTASVISLRPEPKRYNESEKRINDLLHTKLEVKFDYQKAWLYGKATLTLKPYFYPANRLILDAKGFDIAKVALLEGEEDQKALKYAYDGKFINIELDTTYTKQDTFNIYIEYTAKPNELEVRGSAAITSDKGLYFINPDGMEPSKPTQIWTQGETESSSCWYPTIDAPNERMTQEIYMTVDNKYLTLSNGLLMFSLDNGDGTRTDYWKQELGHAPYLTMMAVGEFAVVKDKWRNIDVHYFVEKEYEPYARAIFGNTPEMLEFYSTRLGVDYPWEKYHQIVVRDYVSGAMENTGAVIFGEFMQKNSRELLDENRENIVAHELFHHWFGDLVTTESWANLPLNESFATYGEYLWIEHKYGREAADHHIQDNLTKYLLESRQKQVNMIRFDYEDKEDMFDSHSYAKGGRILHMLRKHVGDEAFFKSLELYLETNKFNPVEIHDLRLAFEKITGEDLNWFFNQWFLASGHPELTITHSYRESDKKAIVTIDQNQDFEKTPLYRLPMGVDIYLNGEIERHKIVLSKAYEEFEFEATSKPDLINVDAEKMILGFKKEKKEPAAWAFQYRNAPLFLDRYEAVENLARLSEDSLHAVIITEALKDKYWGIRVLALKNSNKAASNNSTIIKEQLVEMVQKDSKPEVRASAIKQLSLNFKDASLLNVFKKALTDSSYSVMREALDAIALLDEKEAMTVAKTLENESNANILITIAGIYAKNGSDKENEFFLEAYEKISGVNKFAFISIYNKYLKGRKDETVNAALPVLEDMARHEEQWWMRLSGIQALSGLYNMYSARELELGEELKKATPATPEKEVIEQKMEMAKAQKEQLAHILKNLKEMETDKNLTKFLEVY